MLTRVLPFAAGAPLRLLALTLLLNTPRCFSLAPSVTRVVRSRGRTAARCGTVTMSTAPIAVLAKTLAPRIGIVTSTALYFSPLSAVVKAVAASDMGTLNPLPLALMSISTISWLVYGLSIGDPFVTLSNLPGAIASIGMIAYTLPLLQSAPRAQLRTTQTIVLGGAGMVLSMWTYLVLSKVSAASSSSALGLFASAIFVCLCASPLSTITSVVKERDASSILMPLTLATCANCLLWSAYGMITKNHFVWVRKCATTP